MNVSDDLIALNIKPLSDRNLQVVARFSINQRGGQIAIKFAVITY